MKASEARAAIRAILAAVDDEELPKPTKTEKESGETVIWFGGRGRYLGSAKRNGESDPDVYRDMAARDAIELEATYRLDLAHQNRPSA